MAFLPPLALMAALSLLFSGRTDDVDLQPFELPATTIQNAWRTHNTQNRNRSAVTLQRHIRGFQQRAPISESRAEAAGMIGLGNGWFTAEPLDFDFQDD